jgi:hypothetical protein
LILTTLQAPALTGVLAAVVEALNPLVLSPPLLRTQLDKTVPGSFPAANFSVFEWFRIQLSASRLVARILDGAISVGVDFAGYTNGDPSALTDLTSFSGGGCVYTWEITDETLPGDQPILTAAVEPTGGSIVAVSNMSFISALVGSQIAPSVRNTPVTPQVHLGQLHAGYATFQKPLRGTEDGLAVDVIVVADGFPVNARIMVQACCVHYDGPPPFARADTWRFIIGDVSLDVPWFVDAGVALLTVFLSVASSAITGGVPVFAPLAAIAATALIEGEIPSAVSNQEANAKSKLEGQAASFGPPAPWFQPLPGLTSPRWQGQIGYVSINPNTVDVAIDMAMEPIPAETEQPIASIGPSSWSVYEHTITVTAQLRADIDPLVRDSAVVAWEVARADTGAVVATATRPYAAFFGNGISFGRHNADLYEVDSFIARCEISFRMAGESANVFTGEQALTIADDIDRHHKFIQWGPRVVFFRNQGTGNEWWGHIRRSKIHRTAVSARCLELRQAIRHRRLFTYSDSLPFADESTWERTNENRGPLCEYCFFGGPNKTVPYPFEDWF